MRLEVYRGIPGVVSLDLPFGGIFTRSIIVKGDNVVTIIDTGIKDSYKYLKYLKGAILEEKIEQDSLFILINTHEHYDHVGSNFSLQQKFSCPSIAPMEAAPYMRNHIAQFYNLLGKFSESWEFTQVDVTNFFITKGCG